MACFEWELLSRVSAKKNPAAGHLWMLQMELEAKAYKACAVALSSDRRKCVFQDKGCFDKYTHHLKTKSGQGAFPLQNWF